MIPFVFLAFLVFFFNTKTTKTTKTTKNAKGTKEVLEIPTNNPSYSTILHSFNIEIQQQSQFVVTQSKVCQCLR